MIPWAPPNSATCIPFSVKNKGKGMFYLTTRSTHLICGYICMRHMVKDHSDSERGYPLLPKGLLFLISSKVFLCASSHRQDNTYHGLCYTSRGAMAGTRYSSLGPSWRIDPATRRTLNERSYHGVTSRCLSKIMIDAIKRDSNTC